MLNFFCKVLVRIFKKIGTFSKFREAMVFEVRQKYFADLCISLNVGGKLKCPITQLEGFLSFSEIFVEKEYDKVWEYIQIPQKWIDLGCHRGYFSLYLAQKNQNRLFSALLIDADPRSKEWILALNKQNSLNFKYLHGAISKDASPKFAMRFGMVSSCNDIFGVAEKSLTVPLVSSKSILEHLQPPYDLIKIDIEGAEDIFIKNYSEVLLESKHLILEWHSLGDPIKFQAEMKEILLSYGFKLVLNIQNRRKVSLASCDLWTGVDLWSRL